MCVRLQKLVTLCLTSQNSEGLVYTATEAENVFHVDVTVQSRVRILQKTRFCVRFAFFSLRYLPELMHHIRAPI